MTLNKFYILCYHDRAHFIQSKMSILEYRGRGLTLIMFLSLLKMSLFGNGEKVELRLIWPMPLNLLFFLVFPKAISLHGG